MSINECILKANDLKVTFDKKEILHGIDFNIKRNSITAVIGQSGCGKSTLLKALNLIVCEEGGKVSGNISFEDNNIFSLPIETLRKEIGMVFQQPVVFPSSIYENISFGLKYHFKLNKEELYENVKQSLLKARLFDEVSDTLYESAKKLSGGQQQRLSIARELAIQPKILMLDEPCSALDIKNTLLIEKMLSEIKESYTIIIVTHNLAQAKRISDNIIFMDDGKIIESGNVNKFFNNPKTALAKEYINYMEM